MLHLNTNPYEYKFSYLTNYSMLLFKNKHILAVQQGFIVIFPDMQIMFLDQIHTLSFCLLFPLHSPPFLFFYNFGGFHGSIFVCVYKVLHPYSNLSSPSPVFFPTLITNWICTILSLYLDVILSEQAIEYTANE
jgi:hypothetical protein